MTRNSDAPPVAVAERLLRQDRLIVLVSVLVIVLGASWYTIAGIGMNMSAVEMTRMARPIGEPMQMPVDRPWSLPYALLIFLMWWVMMIAMMTPSAAPVVLLFLALKRVGADKANAARLSLLFLAGYLIAWGGFSLLATLAQWGLEHVGLSDGPMMTVRSKAFAGCVLIAAGLYQLSSLKSACLRHCQSPARFLAEHNRPGASGAFSMGVIHGTFCLGCCWALMLLLFVGGIMNLYWIVAIAIYVALEKLLPRARWLIPATGIGLIATGAWVLASAITSGT